MIFHDFEGFYFVKKGYPNFSASYVLTFLTLDSQNPCIRAMDFQILVFKGLYDR